MTTVSRRRLLAAGTVAGLPWGSARAQNAAGMLGTEVVARALRSDRGEVPHDVLEVDGSPGSVTHSSA